jgi:SAM-dependent methyltransferase
VLDVGCGSGRVAELLLKAGASEYVGIDFSAPMLEMAAHRLQRYGPKVTLVEGDFLQASFERTFDVVVAVGLFDYIAEPHPFARKMYEVSSGTVIASFPKWTWLKGPLRKFRYEVVNTCPIFNFTQQELQVLFETAGFTTVHIDPFTTGGFLVTARH